MSHYRELDRLIVAAIKSRRNPLYERNCSIEAHRLGDAMGREPYRVIDGRLQALRKRGVIVHLTKAEGGGSGGWKVAVLREALGSRDAANTEATKPQEKNDGN